MPTSTQYFNAMTQTAYQVSGISYWYQLNSTQQARLSDAMRLWDDVSNFSAVLGVDDPNLARASTTYITEYFLGIPYNSYWENSLPTDWTRVAIGEIADPNILGINKSYGANNRYHEVFIDISNEGLSTFQLGSRANYTVLHEIGHSIVGGHLTGDLTQTLMQASASNFSSVWYPSTPMTLDIDQAIAMYGASTTTRTGDDVYGFHASFSGGYRAAFDFNANTRPLVTIYDNGGYDTLDASGFVDSSFNSRPVLVNIGQGGQSYMLDSFQTFAVIYRTTWIEAAVTGEGNDTLIGNALNNTLTANGGNDWINPLGGNDNVYGGTGIDTAAFSSASSAYTYWINSNGTIGITGPDGSDLLDSIQRLQFSNGAFDLWQLGLDDCASDFATARSLTLGLSASGSVETKGDHDWFGVTLAAGGVYRFSLGGVGSNDGTLGDSFLTLRDWFGTALLSDDDSGAGLDSCLFYTASTSGTYYLDAYGFSETQIGTYSICAVERLSLTAANNSYTGSSNSEWILGLGGNDTLKGMGGDDLLDGGDGDDVFEGGPGDDTLIGGTGSDTYLFDTDLDLGTDTIDESAGGSADTLDFSATTTRSVTVNLGNPAAQVVNAGLTLVLSSGEELNNVIGGALGDTLTGSSRVNSLTGGGGDDTLVGGANNDTYLFDTDLALGIDTLDESGGGIDTLNFSATTTRSVSVNLATAGPQVVNAGLMLVLGSGGTFENVIGGALADTLTGNALANTFTGGGGNDTAIGGAGNDTYLFDTDLALGSDTLNESGGGIDTLDFSATTTRSIAINLATAGSQVVNAGLTLALSSGATFEKVIGGSHADTLIGNALANTFTGGGGDDTMRGGAGDDTYVFDTDVALGTDTLDESGGGAADTLDFSATTTRAIAINLATPGAQVVNAGLTLILSSGTEFNNVIGGSLGDTLIGNTRVNTLSGGGGNDTLIGGANNDTYLFDTDLALGTDTLNESGGGIDTLNFSATTTRAVTVNLGAAGAQVVNAGLSLVLGSGTTFENVIGGALGDTLTGNTLANTLTGGGGDDTLRGGAGSDIYLFDTDLALGTDTLDESGGGSADTLDFSATTTRSVSVDLANAAAQVVNAGLTLVLSSGTELNNVIGGSLGDTLVGNTQANTFTGGGGNDALAGGAGNDKYVFDTDLALGTDTLDESGGGIDTLDFSATTTRSVSVNLANAGAQVVNAGLTVALGSNATFENVVGGSLADTLIGNALANTLSGGGGNDALIGGGGQDTFRFSAVPNAATNVDFVGDFVAVDDRFLLDQAAFSGIGTVGQLAAANFVAGAAASDANDRVIYNAAAGQLFFDADGNGAGAQVLFATVLANTTVHFDDIWIG